MHPLVAEDLAAVAAGLGPDAAAFEGRSLLISGGAGFLGSYIVGALHWLNRSVLRKPCRATVLDNYVTGARRHPLFALRDPRVRVVEHDVTKPFRPDARVDYILHAAGIASPAHYRSRPIEAIESAIWGAKNLLELARRRKVRAFLFFSSSEIYGDPDPGSIPTPETYHGNVSCTGPRACYDESKRLGETLCMTYHQRFGVPARIVRPFNVYGPGMRLDDRRVIPTFFACALGRRPLPVHDRGLQTRTFCYVSDAVTAFLKILARGQNGEVYNVGNDQGEISMAALAETVAELFREKLRPDEQVPPVEYVEYPRGYPAGEPRRRVPDLSKIRAALGYAPRVDLRAGLRRTLECFRLSALDPQAKVNKRP